MVKKEFHTDFLQNHQSKFIVFVASATNHFFLFYCFEFNIELSLNRGHVELFSNRSDHIRHTDEELVIQE